MGRTVANKVRCVQRFEPYPADKLRRSTARNLTAEDPRFLAAWLPPEYVHLFNHKALAKVFRAKLLSAVEHAGLSLPAKLPATWVVDCRCVGDGQKALLYLSRYLYRGVIQGTYSGGSQAARKRGSSAVRLRAVLRRSLSAG